MNDYPTVSVRLLLLDRPVNLIDEGIDVALRIAHLADSSFVAIRLGEVRRVVAASPSYLAPLGGARSGHLHRRWLESELTISLSGGEAA